MPQREELRRQFLEVNRDRDHREGSGRALSVRAVARHGPTVRSEGSALYRRRKAVAWPEELHRNCTLGAKRGDSGHVPVTEEPCSCADFGLRERHIGAWIRVRVPAGARGVRPRDPMVGGQTRSNQPSGQRAPVSARCANWQRCCVDLGCGTPFPARQAAVRRPVGFTVRSHASGADAEGCRTGCGCSWSPAGWAAPRCGRCCSRCRCTARS